MKHHRLFIVKPGSDEAGMGSTINSLCVAGWLVENLIPMADYVVVLLGKTTEPVVPVAGEPQP